MTHLINEGDDTGPIKGTADTIVARLMELEKEKSHGFKYSVASKGEELKLIEELNKQYEKKKRLKKNNVERIKVAEPIDHKEEQIKL